ncbi:hypothetical protein [Streptomyces mayteni]
MGGVNTEMLVDVWRRLLAAPHKSWVLFENGTCVVLTEPAPEEDLAEQATRIIREFGPVHAGSSAGDFGVITPDHVEGWVVTGHHHDVLTYVAPDEVGGDASEVVIGLAGRGKRDDDGAEPRVVHVEDARGFGGPA